MAKITGKEKRSSVTRELYTGIASIVPVCFNPTKEQLAIATKGQKNFDNDIKYKFPDANGETSYKFDVWCRLSYVLGETGELVQANSGELIEDYICFSWWGGTSPDIFYNEDKTVKGAWYVNPISCGMEWVPANNLEEYKTSRKGKTRLDYSNPKTHIGMRGEKELYQFLDRWLMIEEVDFNTPYNDVLKGNYKEINTVIKENLERTDRSPRAIKVLLGIKETDDNTYQSVYPYTIYDEGATNYNKLRDTLDKKPWKDDKCPIDSQGNRDLSLRKYSETMPNTSTKVDDVRPATATKSGW